MFDFLKVSKTWDSKKQRYVYSPVFIIRSTIKDLMIRSKDFYAIYNEETGLWEKNEARAIELIDAQVKAYAEKDSGEAMNDEMHGPLVKRLADTENRLIGQWHVYCQKDMRDTWAPLDQKVLFSNQTPKREDYATKVLDYPFQEEPTPAYDEMCSVWYLPDEQQKWEWYVGCELAGDATKVQKAIIFYGEPGTGKSSIAEIVIGQEIFGGKDFYAGSFDATALAESKDSFGTDFLEDDPAVAIDGEAKMSVINARGTFNKIISHESVRVNAKFKATYYIKPAVLLIMCANDPIQISPNSGLRRRIIDIQPTGNLISPDRYDWLMHQIHFERSGIAWRCLQTYKKLGRHYYDHYVSEDMMNRTSPFQNFVTENYLALKDGISLANAYKIYTTYAEESNFKNILVRYKFRDTLKLYFDKYSDGKFEGFKLDKIGIKTATPEPEGTPTVDISGWLHFDSTHSLLDDIWKDQPAQYFDDSSVEHPMKYAWDVCPTKLKDIDTSKVHAVIPPDSTHIFIDFDMYGDDGNKSFELNLKAANNFPPTYAELSKSGAGIHLHYIYTGGNPAELSRVFGPNIEVKVCTGKSSIRRKVTKCNTIPIATLASGLPLQEGKKVINSEGFVNEKKLKATIMKALRKDIPSLPSTRQNIDFIEYLLKEAYASGVPYDVRKLHPSVLNFAMGSTNHKSYCVDVVSRMLWCSEDISKEGTTPDPANDSDDYNKRPIIFLDCEIFPSYRQAARLGVDLLGIPSDTPALFLVNWKFAGDDKAVVRMINPEPDDIYKLFNLYRIIGFNNRNYDNHMLWARSQGYTSEELYNLSSNLVDKDTQMKARFGQAYNVSYTDVYDFASAGNKMSLKKWEIKLGLHHQEWNHPWNQPVPVADWEKVAEYCDNDVFSTEALFYHLHGDFLAREILATLAKPYGGTVNSTTNQLTNMIVFEGEKHPGLVYTDFSTGNQYGPNDTFKVPILSWDEYEALGDDWTGVKPKNANHFPGYHLVRDKAGKLHNMYRGVDVKFGGYVYATPGMYGRAVTKDVASMHPHSIVALNLFGEFTQNYQDLMDARIYIKHKEYDKAKELFGGKLAPFLTNDEDAKALSKALKTALNSAYGLTSASFSNAMKDQRNINNIVALRGALVMKTLQDDVQKKGFTVIHIKTDSMKINNPTEDILSYVDWFGKQYGYTYEVEHTWERICLVNQAVFIGRHDIDDPDYVKNPEASEKEFPNRWEAVGTQFQVPYVFKNLFSHQKIDFEDECMTFAVQAGVLYLDFNENLPDVSEWEELKELRRKVSQGIKITKSAAAKVEMSKDISDADLDKRIAAGHNYQFVGRVGSFCPVKMNGGIMCRIQDGKSYAPSGSKDYRWLEAETVKASHIEGQVDISYFKQLCDEAVETINQYGDFDTFVDIA